MYPNREELKAFASDWVNLAKSDIRKKVLDFIEEVDATPRELAYQLAISEDELDQIIHGDGEITISTFAKLLIGTGNALEIKPIEATPIGSYDNIPTEEEMFERPRPNIFERPMFRNRQQQPTRGHFMGENPRQPTRGHFMGENPQQPTHGHFMGPNPQMPLMGHFQSNPPIFPEDVEERNEQPRDEHGRFMSRNQNSPFANKTMEELEKIIEDRLWDSEIDLSIATKSELVKFLDEKNKRIQENRRIKALEEDPKVNEFKNRLKKTLEINPHLREWTKRFINNIDE